MTRKGMAINVNAVLKKQNPNTTYMIAGINVRAW